MADGFWSGSMPIRSDCRSTTNSAAILHALVPRIQVRVVPGEHLGLDAAQSVLTFISWRAAAMDDDRWRRLTASHEFEVVLLKNLIENERI